MDDRRRAAFLVKRGDGAVEAMFAYDAATIEALKATIPYHARHWLAERRTWVVTDHADELLAILRTHDFAPELLVAASATPATPPREKVAAPDPDRAMLGLTAEAPWELVEAAYRTLAKLYHPDVAGPTTTERMTRVNVAYERLQRRRGNGR